jgi:hypothetical protein
MLKPKKKKKKLHEISYSFFNVRDQGRTSILGFRVKKKRGKKCDFKLVKGVFFKIKKKRNWGDIAT